MTITSEGVEYIIETPRYHYFECVGGNGNHKLFPKSVIFRANFIGSTYIKDLRFIDWMGFMLNNKIVVASENMPVDESASILYKISSIEDPFLVVEDTDPKYLLTTLFTILSNLTEENSKLKSLEWIV